MPQHQKTCRPTIQNQNRPVCWCRIKLPDPSTPGHVYSTIKVIWLYLVATDSREGVLGLRWGSRKSRMAISRIVILVWTSRQKLLVPNVTDRNIQSAAGRLQMKVSHQYQNFTHESESLLNVVLLPLWSIFGLLDNFSAHLLNIFAPQWQVWGGDFPSFSALRSPHSLITFKGRIIFTLLCCKVRAFVKHGGIHWAFPAYHHIAKQCERGSGGFFRSLRRQWEWYL